MAAMDLASFRTILAEARRVSKDNGSTLDLSDRRISDLPVEILESIKDDVAR